MGDPLRDWVEPTTVALRGGTIGDIYLLTSIFIGWRIHLGSLNGFWANSGVCRGNMGLTSSDIQITKNTGSFPVMMPRIPLQRLR